MSREKIGTPIEWLWPLAFCLCFGWTVWHGPAYILDFGPENQQLVAQYERSDITPAMAPLFGIAGDVVDYLAILASPILFVIGVLSVREAPMEYKDGSRFDKFAVFVGRITMILIVLLTCVMLYEVMMRYVFERPTIWANELSLWLAGFVFLGAGLYAMQQRSHIRIYLLYDICPRWLQRVFDIISTALIVLFALALFYGGYGEAFAKFMRWETFGTAFDPPIPATLKMMVLLMVALVALQSVINLVTDWNAAPVVHSAADDIDADELEKLRAQLAKESGDGAAPAYGATTGKGGQG
ncbi:MAG TPA: TRAP transporter small permease [Rhizobiaceae bacterium]|nr:TRAP transporter small permease [Rhizobiaceae bacterium]